MYRCTENGEDSHCILRLQPDVGDTGSVYDDSLYAVIPEKHTTCYIDYKKEIAEIGVYMLNACCV